MTTSTIAFIGGGNMATAIVGGLVKQGRPPHQIIVLEPTAAQRERLTRDFGVQTVGAGGPALQAADMVVWAVKPQQFKDAAQPCAPYVRNALQLSVMAGIRTDAIARATGSERVVRAMPNTPALIGAGISGLYARPGVSEEAKRDAEQVLAPTGATLWFEREEQLDAVTALSGSGPAYVFYFFEAMMQAAQEMGLSAEQGKQLALATFAGATQLAQTSADPPSVLRERVTSKGGTTYAALSSMEQDGVQQAFVRALHAAQERAKQLGDEFGA